MFELNTLTSVFTIVGAIAAVVALFVKNISLRDMLKNLYTFNSSLEVLHNYDYMWKKVNFILKNEIDKGYEIQIKNVGLDLEKILPDLMDFVDSLEKNKSTPFSYRGLIINCESEFINPLINGDSNIQTEYIKSSHKKIQFLQDKYKNKENIRFSTHDYSFPLIFHGITINNKYLFLGFTEIVNNKMYGSDKPYIFIEYKARNTLTTHYFSFFNNWFEYYWNYENKK